MILILVIAFFLLGCSFSCNGMKENFASDLIGDLCKAYCRGKYANCDGDCLLCLMTYKDNNLFTAIEYGTESQVFDTRAGKCFKCKRDIEAQVNKGNHDHLLPLGTEKKNKDYQYVVKEQLKNKLKGDCFK